MKVLVSLRAASDLHVKCTTWSVRPPSMVEQAPLLSLCTTPTCHLLTSLAPKMVTMSRVVRGVKDLCRCQVIAACQRAWYLIAKQPAPALHLARPEERATLTHIRVSNSICTFAWFTFSLCAPWAVHAALADHMRRLLEVRDTPRLAGECRALGVGLL